MESVSLCGYIHWPNRVIITLDLKNRRVVGEHCYSTYGQENPWSDRWGDEPSFLNTVQESLAENRDTDRLAALEAVLKHACLRRASVSTRCRTLARPNLRGVHFFLARGVTL